MAPAGGSYQLMYSIGEVIGQFEHLDLLALRSCRRHGRSIPQARERMALCDRLFAFVCLDQERG